MIWTPIQAAEWLLDEIARWQDKPIEVDGPTETEGPIRIIDASKHQGRIDWPRVQAAGIHGVIVKLSEGQGYVDPRADFNVTGAHAAGLVIGGYHFSRINTGTDAAKDARAEVEDFLTTARRWEGAIEMGLLALDVELGGIKKRRSKYVRAWLTEGSEYFHQRVGRWPLIYTGRTTWKYKLGRDDAFAHLPLWLVDYRNRSKPRRTIPGWEWRLWQHSHKGQIPGIRGRVDMNVWHGDRASFDRYLAGDTTEPIQLDS